MEASDLLVVMSNCWLIFMTPYYNLQEQEQ
jgi:hypothetical protein